MRAIIKAAWTPFGAVLSQIDHALVRLVAPAFGMGFSHWLPRYGLLLLLLLGFPALSFHLAQPLGLLCLAIPALGSIAVFRRWMWFESDQERRLIGLRPRLGKSEDLRDEALTAAFLLLMTVPLFVFEGANAYGWFSAGQPLSLVRAYFYVFGILMQEIPVINYSETYGFGNVSGLLPHTFAEKNVEFAIRGLFDFVVIAAIYQFIASSARLRLQEAAIMSDGQQKFDSRAAPAFLRKLLSPQTRLNKEEQRSDIGRLVKFDGNVLLQTLMDCHGAVLAARDLQTAGDLLLKAWDLAEAVAASDDVSDASVVATVNNQWIALRATRVRAWDAAGDAASKLEAFSYIDDIVRVLTQKVGSCGTLEDAPYLVRLLSTEFDEFGQFDIMKDSGSLLARVHAYREESRLNGHFTSGYLGMGYANRSMKTMSAVGPATRLRDRDFYVFELTEVFRYRPPQSIAAAPALTELAKKARSQISLDAYWTDAMESILARRFPTNLPGDVIRSGSYSLGVGPERVTLLTYLSSEMNSDEQSRVLHLLQGLCDLRYFESALPPEQVPDDVHTTITAAIDGLATLGMRRKNRSFPLLRGMDSAGYSESDTEVRVNLTDDLAVALKSGHLARHRLAAVARAFGAGLRGNTSHSSYFRAISDHMQLLNELSRRRTDGPCPVEETCPPWRTCDLDLLFEFVTGQAFAFYDATAKWPYELADELHQGRS